MSRHNMVVQDAILKWLTRLVGQKGLGLGSYYPMEFQSSELPGGSCQGVPCHT